ncbi:hypothetical protein Pelo_18942 [Pelomyxa schiedti]|nr:hypothetical protein Pelo_18942 [Pelomyxa schiedti]
MEFFVIDGLRARDQVGSLASASTTSRFVGGGGGDDVTVTTPLANATAEKTTTLGTECHVLAKLVADGENLCGDTAERCLCVRVSPLLLSIVGEIQDREPVLSYLWVDDTRYLERTFDDVEEVESAPTVSWPPPARVVKRWRLCSAGSDWKQRLEDGVVVCEEPEWFRKLCGEVNSKWMVLFGYGLGGGQVLLVHRFGDSRNKISEVQLDIMADGDTLEGASLRFDGQRLDELILVLRTARFARLSTRVIAIDVEQTHSNGALCVLSITSWSIPLLFGLTPTFVMRKKSGARCFICSEYIATNTGRKLSGVAVEETTGCVTPLAPHAWFDPVSDSVFLIRDATCNNLLICDCNDPTNPSNVIITNSNCSDEALNHQSGNNNNQMHQSLTVRAQSGFLLCTDGSHLRVVEPFTGFCVLTLKFPLCRHLTLEPVWSC